MKDEHDKSTIDLVESQPMAEQSASADARSAAGIPPSNGIAASIKKRKTKRPFNRFVVDEKTEFAEPPKCADRKPAARFGPFANFVPVSFVAKDWQVSSRRVRALLSAGRLFGQMQPNGYWEVRYPYIFTMGTRGPSLKRQQKPEKRLKLVVDNSERMPE